MGAVFCFLLFLAAVGLCILLGQSLILAIWVGIAAFAALGLRRGMTVRAMWDAAWEQGRKMCCVIVIYMLIGAITALWRSAGTIAFFIYHGLRIITPQLFLLVTFLLTSFISYALGTSFGVVGTLDTLVSGFFMPSASQIDTNLSFFTKYVLKSLDSTSQNMLSFVNILEKI